MLYELNKFIDDDWNFQHKLVVYPYGWFRFWKDQEKKLAQVQFWNFWPVPLLGKTSAGQLCMQESHLNPDVYSIVCCTLMLLHEHKVSEQIYLYIWLLYILNLINEVLNLFPDVHNFFSFMRKRWFTFITHKSQMTVTFILCGSLFSLMAR